MPVARRQSPGKRRALGLDCGGSSSKWCVLDEAGLLLAEGRAAPLGGLDLLEGRRETALGTLGEIAGQARAWGVGGAWAGVTGLSAGSAEAAELARALADGLGLPPARVRVESDLDLAYRAHLAPGEGVLVYAGTGAIAYHLTAAGEVLRAGGHGPLLGDEGGGFFLGRAALRALLAHAERSGQAASGPLAAAVFGRVGGADWPAIRRYAYGGGRSAVAALAPLVGEAARAGDPLALAILDAAGDALAELARALLDRLGGPLPVVLAGGALRVHERLVARCRAALPGVQVTHHEAPHEQAAARLALRLATEPPR